MPKKAFIVGFCPQTRVIVDVPEDFDGNYDSPTAAEIIKAAREKILSDPKNYLYGETCDRMDEDLECPYDSENPEDNPSDLLTQIRRVFTKIGKKVITEDSFPEDAEVPAWTFLLEDEAATLNLKSITEKEDGSIDLVWTAPGYRHEESLQETEEGRAEYVIECLMQI